MTAITANQPFQAYYGSPTIRPIQRQPISKPTPVTSPIMTSATSTKPTNTSRRVSPKRRTPSPRQRRSMEHAPRKHIWVVTGPAGCGKTTIAMDLAKELELPYIEGDDWHTKEAVATMAAGSKLTDQYRWDWLITLREQCLRVLRQAPESAHHTDDGNNSATTALPPPSLEAYSEYNNPHVWTPPSLEHSTHPPSGVVLTCSALKRKYRDEFRVASHPIHAHDLNISISFIYCDITEEESTRRVLGREGHYMKAAAVRAQFDTLERPEDDELSVDSLRVDANDTPERVRTDVWAQVQQRLQEEAEEDEDHSAAGSEEESSPSR